MHGLVTHPRRAQPGLGAALLDLDRGYLTVGGETGVGRGAAAVTALTLNGRSLAKETLLNALTEAAK